MGVTLGAFIRLSNGETLIVEEAFEKVKSALLGQVAFEVKAGSERGVIVSRAVAYIRHERETDAKARWRAPGSLGR